MSTPPENDPFNPSTWAKPNQNQNQPPQPVNNPQQPNYTQPQTPQNPYQQPNYSQPQNPYQQPNYNQQQFPQNPYQQQNFNQQQFPPPGGYQPYGNFPGGMQIELPSAGTAQICGIIGIVLFWNLIGIILNIVAVVNGSRGETDYRNYPGRYTEDSLRRARTGKICGTIGLCLLGLTIVIAIIVIAANS